MVVQPKVFPSSGFEILPTNSLVDEERLPNYKAKKYYPMRLGDVIKSRYQVLAKLGFGGGSTVWLCRDLEADIYLALKVCVMGEDATKELAISEHVKSLGGDDHPGRATLRVVLDHFQIQGPLGSHMCLLFTPAGLTLKQLRDAMRQPRFPTELLRHTFLYVLLGLDVLHQTGAVHTDLSPNNLLLGVTDDAPFAQIEQMELENPTARKILADRRIHLSYIMPLTRGNPLITDFGESRLGEPGQKHSGDVMPGIYRAPEIIIGADWDCKIDMWSMGVMIWDLLEGRNLFGAVKDGQLNDELHLAEMVSLLGPPPRKFLEMSDKCRQYWDSEGNWIAATQIPDQTLERRITHSDGKDKEQAIAFARRVLCWLPEDRATAEDLLDDPFLVLESQS